MLIVWDYYGVVEQDYYWGLSNQLIKKTEDQETIDALHNDLNLGGISWHEYCARIAADLGQKISEVEGKFKKHNINKQTIMAIQSLKDHRHVLLSNASGPYLSDVMKSLGIDSLFDEIFISSEIGYIKPDHRAFLHVLAATKSPAGDSVMVDNSPRNIVAAKEVGMQGILFEEHKNILHQICDLVR